MCMSCHPSGVTQFPLAWHLSKYLTTSRWPLDTAEQSGVQPSLLTGSTPTCCSLSSTCHVVSQFEGLAACTSRATPDWGCIAHFCLLTFTTSKHPKRLARCSGVSM